MEQQQFEKKNQASERKLELTRCISFNYLCIWQNQGVMKDQVTVAIKKIVVASKSGKTDLDSEIQIISNVHHRYLVRFLGCCRKGPHMYLVLEYMENGSLDKFLYGELI